MKEQFLNHVVFDDGYPDWLDGDIMIDKSEIKNYIDKEKNVTTVLIDDFKAITPFSIFTPTFKFNSHLDTEGWYLVVKQWNFKGKIKRTTVRLCIDNDKGHILDSIRIRISKEMAMQPIRNIDDATKVFCDFFDVLHVSELKIGNKHISNYSDEELLAEVNRRTAERIKAYPKPTKKRIIDNVIQLPIIRPVVVDEERLQRALAS